MTQYSSYDAPERAAKRGFLKPKYIVLGSMGLLGCVMLFNPKAMSSVQNVLNHGLAKAMGAEEVMGYSTDQSNSNGSTRFIKEGEGAAPSLPSSSVPVRRLTDN